MQSLGALRGGFGLKTPSSSFPLSHFLTEDLVPAKASGVAEPVLPISRLGSCQGPTKFAHCRWGPKQTASPW